MYEPFATAWTAGNGLQVLVYRWDTVDEQGNRWPTVYQLMRGPRGQAGAPLGFESAERADAYWGAIRQPGSPERGTVETALGRAYALLP